MNWLIRRVFETGVFANLLLVGLVAAGLLSLATLTVKNFPDLSTGTISITVTYPGATAQDVSDSVVEPIESAIRSIEGIRKITATASEGQARIIADLTRGADPETVKDDIQTEVRSLTSLPQSAEEPVIVEVEPEELAIQFVLSGDLPADTLKAIAVSAREDLQAIDGISQVRISGAPEDRISVEVPQAQLLAYGTTLGALAERIGNATADYSAGTLDGPEDRVSVRTAGERDTGAAIGEIVVFSSPAGAQVRLDDFATISDGLAEDPVLAEIDGHPAVFVNVFRAGSEPLLNIVSLTQDYLENELEPRLPETVTLTEWRNQATSLQGRIDLLVKNGIIGAALILVILTLALDIRIAAWVSVGIAVSFIGTFALMALFGVSISQLSLFAFILSLGIVVDDAIVVGEAIYTERQSGKSGPEAALDGTLRMARPVFFSVATTVLAFVPLLFIPGLSGSFLAPVAAVVIMVLGLSLVESFFVLPTHLSHLRSGEPRRFSPRRLADPLRRQVGGRIDSFADTRFRRVAETVDRHPGPTLVLCLGLLLASLAPLTLGFVRFVFFPDIEGNFVSAELQMSDGTSVAATRAQAEQLAAAMDRAAGQLAEQTGEDASDIRQASAILIGVPSVSGGPPGGTESTAASTARIEVKIADAETRDFSAGELVDLWRAEAGEIAGARSLSFSTSEVGIGADIVLNIAAGTPEARAAAVDRIRSALVEKAGVTAIRDSRGSSSEEVVATLSDQGGALGVELSSVARGLRNALFGAVATEFQRNREEVEVRVRLPASDRDTIADLQDLRLPAEGGLVPIGTVADLAFQPAPSTITRIDGSRVTTVTADVTGGSTTGSEVTDQLMTETVPQLRRDYPDLEITLGGEQEEQSRFAPALLRNAILALLGIYALLTLAFGSYTRPLILLTVLPFGLVGTILGHWALGLELTLLSMFGLIGLMGILLNNALLLVIRTFECAESGSSRPVVDAMVERLRPIILTTVTTFLGVTPLILETSLQAQFLIPTAVALGFGILVGSFFTLAVVPAVSVLYLRLSDHGKGKGAIDAS